MDRAAVRDPRAYLVRIATRPALIRLHTPARRCEDHVGEWLPGPLLTSRRPRMVVTPTEQQRVVDRFLAVLTAGDVQGLMDVLAPDVVVVADSGGLAPAARRPVSGRERVTTALSHFAELAPGVGITTPLVNGTVAVRIDPGGGFDTAITSVVVEDGRISRMYAMRNPHELGRLDAVAELRR